MQSMGALCMYSNNNLIFDLNFDAFFEVRWSYDGLRLSHGQFVEGI